MNKKKEKEFIIPVTWSVYGYVTAKGETLVDALKYANEHLDDYPLPSYSEYVDGSFEITGLDNYRNGIHSYDYKKATKQEYEIYQNGTFDKYAE